MPVRSHFVALAGALCLVCASPLAAQSAEGAITPAERRELASYRLTMDNIKKAATAGVQLNALEKSNPKVKAAVEDHESASLTDAIAKLNGLPEARAVVEANGLTARDFLYTLVEFGYTRAAVRLQAMGGPAAKGAAAIPTSPQNLQFYAANQAKLDTLATALTRSDEGSDE